MNYKMIPILGKSPVLGITLELSETDATHLTYALSRIRDEDLAGQQKWPWLQQFKINLERARDGEIIEESRLCENLKDVK